MSQERGNRLRLLAGALDIALLLVLILAPLVWLFDPFKIAIGPLRMGASWRAGNLVLPLVLLAARVAAGLYLPQDQRGRLPLARLTVRRILLAWCACWGVIVLANGVLKFAGFKYEVPPIVVSGGDDGAPDTALVPDAQLLWRFQPGRVFRGRPVNNLGFLDRPVAPAKEPGAVRVICMGDSCSAQGWPTYAGMLHARLTNAPPDGRSWEAFNMAVHGYCVVQGRRLFQLQGAALAPDYVFLYYGWNDHWLSRMPVSRELAIAGDPARVRLFEIMRRKPLGQLLIKLGQDTSRDLQSSVPSLRVPEEEYRATLAAFAADIRSAGAVPVIMTAPRAERLAQDLVRGGNARSVEEAAILHDRYVAITREVAKEKGIALLDLAALFAGNAGAGLFQRDGVHLTGAGLERVAGELHAFLERQVKGTPGGSGNVKGIRIRDSGFR